jgi:FtsP/CotA-like multicopper oxidase with cupredoxin domain
MSAERIGRRQFLKLASVISAAGVVVMHARPVSARGMGGGGSGGGIMDPPLGPTLVDPADAENASSESGVVEVNLRASVTTVDVNGTPAELMTYNAAFPASTIRVRRGDVLKVHLTNGLPETTEVNLLGYRRNVTNLHTHGWHVSPEAPSDDVLYHLMPGQTYDHEYDTMLQPGGTLNFYHPHIHGLSAEQYWAGLVGALVVEDETDVLASFETHLLILKDITLSAGAPAPHATMMDYMHGKEGSIVMVNGQVNPRLDVKTGQVQRWRILNASNARMYRLSVEGHAMSLIGTDGGLLDRPYTRSEILVSPGERVDVLVKMTQRSGAYRLLALPYSRMGMMQSPTITLMTLAYTGRLSPAQSIPASIDADATRLEASTVTIAAERTLVLSMGQANAYINGQDFDVDPYEFMSEVGTYERWTVVNQSGMDHPFHQHVNAAQVLRVSGGDAFYATVPAWKDTTLIPRGGSVELLVPIMDHTGMTMFHCHILEHEDIGMMGMYHVMGAPMPM